MEKSQKKTLKKTVTVTDTKLYKNSIDLLKVLNIICKNINLCDRQTYGTDVCRNVRDIVLLYRKGYEETNNSTKISIFEEIKNKLREIDTSILILYELKIITTKQYANLLKPFNYVYEQTNNFYNSLKTK